MCASLTTYGCVTMSAMVTGWAPPVIAVLLGVLAMFAVVVLERFNGP
jgi:CHASE2 domain-containing sensor protein